MPHVLLNLIMIFCAAQFPLVLSFL